MRLIELLDLYEKAKAKIVAICHRTVDKDIAHDAANCLNEVTDHVHELLKTKTVQEEVSVMDHSPADTSQALADVNTLTAVQREIMAHPVRVQGVPNKFGNSEVTHLLSDEYQKMKEYAVATIEELKVATLKEMRVLESLLNKKAPAPVEETEEEVEAAEKSAVVPIPEKDELMHPNEPLHPATEEESIPPTEPVADPVETPHMDGEASSEVQVSH